MALTHLQQINTRYGFPLDRSWTLKDWTELVGLPPHAVDAIISKGEAAYYTNYRSVREKGTFRKGRDVPPKQKLSPSQWGRARLAAFVNKIQAGRTLDHDTEIYSRIKHLLKKPPKN